MTSHGSCVARIRFPERSLYPSSVTYSYKFFDAECWDSTTGNYNFNDTLGWAAWPKTWEGAFSEKTKGTNACNAARAATGSAMFPSRGNFMIVNQCDAPCGPGSTPYTNC